MATAKDIILKPISSKQANELVRRVHYSGKVDPRSQIHIGVFLYGRLEGAMQFGPSLSKRNIQGLVRGTGWNEFIELNRMAFTDALPRNSESRAIGIAMKLLRKHAPQIKWVISFADACQCGDGTIYRASGFVLTGAKKNSSMWLLPSGEVICDVVSRMKGSNVVWSRIGFKVGESWSTYSNRVGAKPIPGYQLRYIYFLDKSARQNLTVAEIPFSRIEEIGAKMYRGKHAVEAGE